MFMGVGGVIMLKLMRLSFTKYMGRASFGWVFISNNYNVVISCCSSRVPKESKTVFEPDGQIEITIMQI